MNRKAYQAQYYQRTKLEKRQVRVTLSHDELREFQRVADLMDITVAETLKKLAKGALKSERFVDTDTKKELTEFNFNIRNISNNLNQIAKHSNRVKQVSDSGGVFDLIRQLEQTVKDFITRSRS